MGEAAKRLDSDQPSEPAEAALTLADGTRAIARRGGLELRDPEGRLLLRYTDGQAELSVPRGDLVLAAPHGRVRIQSGQDVAVEAERDVVWSAQRSIQASAGSRARLELEPESVRLSTRALEVDAVKSSFTGETTQLVARSITTTAERLATRVDHYELEAHQLVERAHTAYRDVADLLQTRLGRVRAIVRDVYALRSRRTVMVSEEDTSIDGERILLG